MTKTKQPKLSDVAKNALRNQRRRLANEQAEVEARKALEARSLLNRETKPLPIAGRPTVKRTISQATAIERAVVPRIAAVLASENVKARVYLNLSPEPGYKSAYTDFRDIRVDYGLRGDEDLHEIAAILRGTCYHEGGHIRFTTRPEELVGRYRSDETIDQDKRDALGQIWSSFGKRRTLHYAWNLAEDQRMEMLVVEDSPRKAAYFAPMVIDIVLNIRKMQTDVSATKAMYETLVSKMVNEGMVTQEWADAHPFNEQAARAQRVAAYPLIAWRRYLPRDLRRAMRREFVEVWGQAKTARIEHLILTYITTSSVEVAVDALIELAPLLVEVMVPPTDHDQQRNYRNQQPAMSGADMDGADEDYEDEGEGEGDADVSEAMRQAGMSAPKQDPAPTPTPADSGDSEDEGDESDGEGEGDSEGDSNSQPCDQRHNMGAGTEAGNHDVDRMLEQAKEEAEEQRNGDHSVQGDVSAINEILHQDTWGSFLTPYRTAPSSDWGVVAQAQNMASDMVQAFHEVNTERLPTWQEQQTRGVLNVGRYVTRQPGDREYFRSWSEEQAPGRNIAVSVLLDYSGSMTAHVGALSATAYAMKAACDTLDIPCTVLLWDHEATVLWEGKDKAEYVPDIVSAGGTNPRVALDDVQHHRYDKDVHIVLVMTDGEFSSLDNWLNEYRTEGTYFLGAVFGRGGSRSENEMAKMGFDRYAAIETLPPLVRLLEQAIIDIAHNS